jgi:DNA polymerase
MAEDRIHLDVETFNHFDVRKVGAYRYARDPSLEVLIACYAINEGPVETWLPYKQIDMPRSLERALERGALVVAHNAEFEREVSRNAWDLRLPRNRWRCTAVRAAAAGLPRALGGALAALGGSVQKDTRGGALIRTFCKPRKPTKKNASIRVMPEHEPEKFEQFIEYCRQDVRSERQLDRVLPAVSDEEWRYFHYNMLLNDRGLPLDVPNIERTIKAVREIEKYTLARTRELTDGINPTQVAKLLAWIRENGVDIPNLQLKMITEALESDILRIPANVREVLELRLEASKASTKKLQAMKTVACEDNRAHGVFLFYGAHTGRNAGKLIQPHNFTRGKFEDPLEMIQVLRAFSTGDAELVWMMYDQPMDALAQSMRGFIRAPSGFWFPIADYGAIETRVLAWLANEVKLLAIYHRNLTLPKDKQIDVYKLMATVLYHVKYAAVSKEQRRIGKNLRLGAGFQLGEDGLLKNCEKEGIPMERPFAKEAIRAYREDNKNIVQLWYDSERAALDCIDLGKLVQVNGAPIAYEPWKRWLVCHLPSGRRMHYFDPQITMVRKFRKMKRSLSYFSLRKKGPPEGLSYGDQPDRNNRVHTYGGKLVENYVQATARDIMMFGMLCAERAGYPVLANVHDEIITLRKKGEGDVHELEQVICTLPQWAKGLPLIAEGFGCEYYRKG